MRERNPRGRNRSLTLCALEIYPERCRKTPAQPEKYPRPGPGPTTRPTAAPGTRPERGQQSWGGAERQTGSLGAGFPPGPARSFLTRLFQERGLLLPSPRRLPAPRLMPGGGRAGGAVSGAGAPRPPHLEAGSASRRAAPEAPRPPPALCPGAPAPRLGASSWPAGAGRGARRGGSGTQRRGQPSRPPWFRSIVGRLTQSAAIWPRLAPSPPGAPRPRRFGAGGVGKAARARPGAQSGQGMALQRRRCP